MSSKPENVDGSNPAAASRRVHARMTEPVVQAALLRVGNHRIGFCGLLEAVFRGLVTRIAIRVMLHGQLAVGALDVAVARRARDTEDLVVIPLAHAFATFTIAGRSMRSLRRYPRRSSPMTSPSR